MLHEILSRVPDYQCFYTTEEMDQRSREVKQKFGDRVELFNIGRSREGREIQCLKIGEGKIPVLLIGCPHPNEPVGSMLIDSLISELLNYSDLSLQFDFTWYMIKSSDIDGTALNEGWFKGPFTITHYIENFFRPAFHQQVEWSFPIDYKNYHFNKPIPETLAIMKLIEKVPFRIIYSLHNTGFGGCYWYLTQGNEELYSNLYNASKREGIPLSLGEAEVPYAVKFSNAVYGDIGLREQYDYLEKNLPDFNPEEDISGGANCVEYANLRSEKKVYSLVNEVPYFFDPRVNDMSESQFTRRELLLENCKQSEELLEKVRDLFQRIKPYITTANPYIISVEERVKHMDNISAKRAWLERNHDFNRKASISQEFDNLYGSRFFDNLNFTLLAQGIDRYLLEEKGFDLGKKQLFKNVGAEARELMQANNKHLEDILQYQAIPIRKLVRLQLASGLIFFKYVQELIEKEF